MHQTFPQNLCLCKETSDISRKPIDNSQVGWKAKLLKVTTYVYFTPENINMFRTFSPLKCFSLPQTGALHYSQLQVLVTSRKMLFFFYEIYQRTSFDFHAFAMYRKYLAMFCLERENLNALG